MAAVEQIGVKVFRSCKLLVAGFRHVIDMNNVKDRNRTRESNGWEMKVKCHVQHK